MKHAPSEENLWMLDGFEPRAVQLEALRRSFLGYSLLSARDAEPRKIILRDGPATGWGHFMQMRLGKTPTLLNEFLLARKWYGYKKLVVIAPNTYKNTWGLEIEKFLPGMPYHIIESNKIKAAQAWCAKNHSGILLVNYEAVGRADAVIKLLTEWAGPDTMVGGDESIIIKGYDSLMTRRSIDLAKRCGLRRPMSGKPITQGPHDIWSQLRFAGHLSGYLYAPFKSKFAKMGGFQGKQVVGVVEEHEAELASIIANAGFVARRSDWMDHYATDYSHVVVPMEPKQAELYAQMDEEFVMWLNEAEYVKADQVITKLMKLQQISSGFIIDEMKVTHDLVDQTRNPKMLQLIHMLDNEIEGKAIIAVHFKHSIDTLMRGLAKYNPVHIRGQQKDIDDHKARFNGDDKCRVIVGQIQAIKYGHTLIGSKKMPCMTTLMYENTFSLDDRSQIEERNQGADQRGPTSVVDFICAKNDLRPIEALRRKEDVAAALLQFRRSTGILPR